MRKKIKCPHCGKVQLFDESYHYGNKTGTILVWLILAIITSIAFIISIFFWGVVIYQIATFNTRSQTCISCKKLIESSDKYLLDKIVSYDYISCDKGKASQILIISSLIIAAANNKKEDFEKAFSKLSFLEFPINRNIDFLSIQYSLRPTNFIIKTYDSLTFENYYYQININKDLDISIQDFKQIRQVKKELH